MTERIQKLLAAAGLCSRRTAEEWIAAGRVTVNGRRVRVGDKADPETDDIRVDGRPLRGAAQHVYLRCKLRKRNGNQCRTYPRRFRI